MIWWFLHLELRGTLTSVDEYRGREVVSFRVGHVSHIKATGAGWHEVVKAVAPIASGRNLALCALPIHIHRDTCGVRDWGRSGGWGW